MPPAVPLVSLPLQLAFSPHSPGFLYSAPSWPLTPQPHHVYLGAILSCCCALLCHPLRATSPSCSLVPLFLLPPWLCFISSCLLSLVCGREAYHVLIGAIGNLWAPVAVGRAALCGNPLPCPSSAVSPIILGRSLDLCHSH